MADKTALTIEVTRDERHHIEELAKARGFDNADELILALVKRWLALVEVTAEDRLRIEELASRTGYETLKNYLLALVEFDAQAYEESLDTEEDLLTRFKRSLQDALAGRTHPVSTLWDGIEDE